MWVVLYKNTLGQIARGCVLIKWNNNIILEHWNIALDNIFQ